MAKNFLDNAGLVKYDRKIKEYIVAKDAEALKSAKSYADGLAKNYDSAGSAAQALEDAKSYVNGREVEIQSSINGLKQLVGDTAVATQINTAVSDAKTELKGNESDTDASETITGAKKYADKLDAAMDARVDALEAAVGTGGSVSSQITTEIQKLDATVETAAIPEGQDGIHVKVTEVDGKLTAVEAEIEVSNEINAAKAELEGKIGTVTEGKTLAGMIADNTAAIEEHKNAINAKVTTLIGSDADKSVRTIANEELAAQLIPEGAKEALDSLQEIAAWIQSHPDDASAMNQAIAALQAKTKLGTYIPDKQTEPVEYATVEAYVEAIKQGLTTSTTELASRVSANEQAIATINGDSNTAGSINKALADAKEYTDNKIQSMTSEEIEAIIAAAKTSQPQS